MDRFYALAALLLSAGLFRVVEAGTQEYGVDCSFPIHNREYKCDHLGDKKKLYEDYMQGCRDYYGKKGEICDITENERMDMNQFQPHSMINYTSTGFKKIRAPDEVMELLYNHWETNKNAKEQEQWPAGNIYVNHWETPTYVVSLDNAHLRGIGSVKSKIWDGVQPVIENWTGK